MNNQYLTRSELTKRWTSWKLVERFFPTCSKTIQNPHCLSEELYNSHQVKLIESSNSFKQAMSNEILRRRMIREYKKMMSKAQK